MFILLIYLGIGKRIIVGVCRFSEFIINYIWVRIYLLFGFRIFILKGGNGGS